MYRNCGPGVAQSFQPLPRKTKFINDKMTICEEIVGTFSMVLLVLELGLSPENCLAFFVKSDSSSCCLECLTCVLQDTSLCAFTH